MFSCAQKIQFSKLPIHHNPGDNIYIVGYSGETNYRILGKNVAKALTDSLRTALTGKQATLISGVNIATINGMSLLNGGNLTISGGEGPGSFTPSGTTSQYITGAGTYVTFPTDLSAFANGPGYVTSSALTSYVTNTTLTGTLANYVTRPALVDSLTNYVRLDTLSARLAGYVVEEEGMGLSPLPFTPELDAKLDAIQPGATANSHDTILRDLKYATGQINETQIAASAYTDINTWEGSGAITKLGTVTTGTWNANVIAPAKLGTGTNSSYTFLHGAGKWAIPFVENRVAINDTYWGSSTINNVGSVSPGTYGTVTTNTLSTANTIGQFKRLTATASSTSSWSAGFKQNTGTVYRGEAAGKGGFLIAQKFCVESTASDATVYAGLRNTTSAITWNVDPSSLVNIIGVGKDVGDGLGAFKIMHNDGSGAATEITTNIPIDTTTYYTLVIEAEPNSANVKVTLIDNAPGGNTYSATINTNIPSNTTSLVWHCHTAHPAGTVPVAIGWGQTIIKNEY